MDQPIFFMSVAGILQLHVGPRQLWEVEDRRVIFVGGLPLELDPISKRLLHRRDAGAKDRVIEAFRHAEPTLLAVGSRVKQCCPRRKMSLEAGQHEQARAAFDFGVTRLDGGRKLGGDGDRDAGKVEAFRLSDDRGGCRGQANEHADKQDAAGHVGGVRGDHSPHWRRATPAMVLRMIERRAEHMILQEPIAPVGQGRLLFDGG